jgi:hypothetical protein
MDLDRDEGTLFFGAELEDSLGGSDVYALGFAGGRYGEPENVGPPVNTEASEFAVLTAPDETFLVVYRFDPENRDASGLWVTMRHAGGTWSEPVDLDARLGLGSGFDASLSPDGEYVFVLDRGAGVYWVKASMLSP